MQEVFVRKCLDQLHLYRRRLDQARQVQQQVLEDIACQFDGTSISKFHDVHGVHTISDWKSAVPIQQYSDLEPFVQRILDGDHQSLTRSPPYGFYSTSGTCGRPKLVPSTRHHRQRYRGPALYAQWGLYFESMNVTSLDQGTVLDLSWERRPPEHFIRNFPVGKITHRPASVGGGDWTPPWYDEPWFVRTQFDSSGSTQWMYQTLRLLIGSPLRIIVSVNPSKITLLGEVLRESIEELIKDTYNGTIAGRRCDHVVAQPSEARRLERCVARSGGAVRLTDCWPTLSHIVCWNSASAALYKSWLMELAPTVEILPFSSTGTEGIVTIPLDGHESAGPLAMDQGIYEFVESGDEETGEPLAKDAETLSYDQLEPGCCYRVVMSQANGFYRYDVGDRYRMVDWCDATPRLEFIGRALPTVSFTGEKITEDDVWDAVTRGLEMERPPMFCLAPVWGTPPGYVLAIEFDESLAHSELPIETCVERSLGELNIEYAEKTRSNRLRPIRVIGLRPGAFREIANSQCQNGQSLAQFKHQWLSKDASILEFIEDLNLSIKPDQKCERKHVGVSVKGNGEI